MKRILPVFICVIPSLAGNAQLPKWTIPPTNDTIYVKVNDHLLQTVENGKSSLWTMDGNPVYSTENTILSFKDGVATIIDKQKNAIVGIVGTDGKFTGLPNLQIAYNNPFFENGYLLGKDKDTFVYYKRDGIKADMPYAAKAYPFHNGYAPYLTYSQVEKKKDPHYRYYKADGQISNYKIVSKGEAKDIEPKNISFLSGIGTNGKGVAVIKDKLYWFIPETESFEPFLWGNEDSEKKRHLSLACDYGQFFLNLPSDSVTILAKYGKNKIAKLRFNNELLPTLFSFEDDSLKFEKKPETQFNYASKISKYGNDSFGLSLDSKKVLPQQFQNVGLTYGNRAFVKLDGKWGVVEIMPDLDFVIKINKGEDVAFRHQKFETQVRLDLPASISAKDAKIDISEDTGCLIDKTSRETKDTESGNFVTYNCVLNIPESLPDTITTITYSPVRVSYDRLRMFDVPISIKSWHLKYYNVDPIDSETSISNGVASFTININAQKNVGESDYPFEVKVEADSVSVDYEKLSETRYKCFVSNLQEGDNNLNIVITEKGCPPSVFPFEIFYSKPVPRKKKNEEVIIRKKTPETRKPTPRLEI